MLSFALIGRFWIVHHRAFTLLERFDGTLMVLNLVFLALIVVMPFATDLVAEYEDDPVCIVVYASVVGPGEPDDLADDPLLAAQRPRAGGHAPAGGGGVVVERARPDRRSSWSRRRWRSSRPGRPSGSGCSRSCWGSLSAAMASPEPG